MKALISPEENNRIAEVAVQSFEVAQPLYWVDCPADCTTQWTYVNSTFLVPVIPEPVVIVPPTKEQLLVELQALTAKIQALGAI
jgi:hypothetical protein